MADRIVHVHRPRGCFTEVNVMMPISQTEKLRHVWMEKMCRAGAGLGEEPRCPGSELSS